MDHIQTVDSDAVLPPDAIREPTQSRGRYIFTRLSEAAVVVDCEKRNLTATHVSNVRETYCLGQLTENAASVVETTSRRSTPDIS